MKNTALNPNPANLTQGGTNRPRARPRSKLTHSLGCMAPISLPRGFRPIWVVWWALGPPALGTEGQLPFPPTSGRAPCYGERPSQRMWVERLRVAGPSPAEGQRLPSGHTLGKGIAWDRPAPAEPQIHNLPRPASCPRSIFSLSPVTSKDFFSTPPQRLGGVCGSS